MDKRFDGYPLFKYRVSISGEKVDRAKYIFQILKWMTETYGHSVPLEHFLLLDEKSGKSTKWSWKDEEYGIYIYLKDNEEMQWFTLKWC